MSSTDTNQASEELSHRQKIVNCFNGDDFVPVRAIDNIQNLIRTEKLKLLAEVRERVVGEDETRIPADGGPFTNTTDKPNHYITLRNANRADQRAALTKLEAEL